MRGCLKSNPSTPRIPQGPVCDVHRPAMCSRKCVSFEEGSLETVFIADEWDRTPMEPSRKLSYQDLLELKEIQRSLPRADQPADHISGRAGRQYLKGVPIGLLPLLPESSSAPNPQSPATPSPTTSPTTGNSSWMSFSPSGRQTLEPTSPPLPSFDAALHPPRSSLFPNRQQVPRQKPRFAFLPLLDTPTAGQTSPTLNSTRSRTPSPDARSDRSGPPTPSLTNASLDSSPMSQASTCSVEPPYFQLPPPKRKPDTYHPTYPDHDADSFPRSLSSAMQNMKLAQVPQPPFPFESNKATGFGRSNPAFKPVYTIPSPPPAPSKPKKAKNVIVVNGIEIDLDGSDDEDEEPAKPSSPIRQPQPVSPLSSPTRSSSSPGSPSSITSNGLPTPPPSTSPSPTLTHRIPLPPTEPESPFVGLHAPVRFKRATPQASNSPAPGASTSPSLSTSPQRRGSFCGQQSVKQKTRGQQGYDPRSSPILVPRA
ncbi:hypothetical protein DFP72DRAFT_134095 [Ephemerocybe angulata]|uniref:Uncharacterized protein n=1 Tax=Ephemerocybe angulata TaxID=980116 RepID=A0A8H6I5P1_9AGAR|nr:hypothetical protein DFP72DRAFT_134095 [Tulosesus angulatus]